MGDFTAWFNTLSLGPANTLLLVLVIVIIKKKLAQHDEMYVWYLVKRALEKQRSLEQEEEL